MLTPKRIYVEEMLDAGLGTDEDVAENLSDLRRINRMLGGTRVVLRAIADILSGAGVNHISLLDVGTGSADIPTAVADWCESRGINSFIAALDISERNLKIARAKLRISSEVRLLRADALRLPFASDSFDYVTASLFLHHFEDDDVAGLLAEFARVARRGVIVNDLVRNLVPYYFIKAAGPIFARNFLTRNDGPVSVLRGFTPSELINLAERAGLNRFKVKRVFPYRLSLIADLGSR